jgi:hypothetical protein
MTLNASIALNIAFVAFFAGWLAATLYMLIQKWWREH